MDKHEEMKTKMPLHTKIFIGLLTGVILGFLFRWLIPDSAVLYWIVSWIARPMGQIFLRIIFMAVVPLIVAALILGVSEIGEIGKIGRVGLKTFFFTFLFSSIAVLIGIGAVNLFAPGKGISTEARTNLLESIKDQPAIGSAIESAKKAKSVQETIIDLFPFNPLSSANSAFEGGLIPLMVFSLIVGIAMSLVGKEKSGPLKNFLESVLSIMLKIIDIAMYLAPFGVAGLIFSVTALTGIEAIGSVVQYFFLVLCALLVHIVVVYSAAIRFVAKRNPLTFFKDISEVIITAFATSSSNATLPVTLKAAQENLKLPREISNFVLTIGATANQNGTALYEGVTVLFLAQLFGIDLTLSQQFAVAMISIMAGVGTAGVPGGSLPLIVIVLQQFGIPGESIGIILGIDRILDMSRTVVNVTGDLAIAACVSASEKEKK